MRIRGRELVGGVAAGAVLGLGLYDALRGLDPWSLRPASCLPVGCFCEAVSGGTLAQPVNSVTSLAFVVAGVAAWLRRTDVGPRTVERRLIIGLGLVLVVLGDHQPASIVSGAGRVSVLRAKAVVLGVSSFLYHATLSYAGQVVDIAGMYLLGTLLAAGALVRRRLLHPGVAVVGYVVVNALLAVIQYVAPDTRRILFAVVLMPGIFLELAPSVRTRAIEISLGCIGLGYVLWLLDSWGTWCDSESIWQGHGAWHILGAAAAYLLVDHYRRSVGGLATRGPVAVSAPRAVLTGSPAERSPATPPARRGS